MPDSVALLIFALLVLVPVALVWVPLVWYGKRHGWGTRQYAWSMVAVAVCLFALLALFILRAPPTQVAKFSLITLLLGVLYALGLMGWDRFLRERRNSR